MTAEVELHQPQSAAVQPFLPARSELESVFELAASLAKTQFVPKPLQGQPAAVAACMLYGRELGLGFMQALQQIQVVEGKPSASPELMRSLVRGRGHKIAVKAKSHDSVTLVGTRGDDGTTEEITWTVKDAVRAGLCTLDGQGVVRARSSKGNPLPWETYTRSMLMARATSELCRSLFPDVISGVSYTPEEAASTNPRNRAIAGEIVVDDEDGFDEAPASTDSRPVVEQKLEQVPAVAPITQAQFVLMQDVAKRASLTNTEINQTVEALIGSRVPLKQLTEDQADLVLESLQDLAEHKARQTAEADAASSQAETEAVDEGRAQAEAAEAPEEAF